MSELCWWAYLLYLCLSNCECFSGKGWCLFGPLLFRSTLNPFIFSLNCSLGMNVFAAYVAYSQGITTLAQLVCAEFRSTWGKRKMWSVCTVDVRAVQVVIECLYYILSGLQVMSFCNCCSWTLKLVTGGLVLYVLSLRFSWSFQFL